jgi:putative ABC transport system permease protein
MILPYSESFYLQGDFEEEFSYLYEKKGAVYANMRMWIMIFESAPGFIYNSIYWSAAMIKNYLKIAVRNITGRKLFSSIHIFGLSLGIACSILTFLFVRHEFSFDSFHEKADSLYRVWEREFIPNRETLESMETPFPLGPAMKADYPEILSIARLLHISRIVKTENAGIAERITLVDPEFFDMFSFSIKVGNSENPLYDLNSIVIAEDIALKYFNEKNPLGETIRFQLAETEVDFTVTAVIENAPNNSSISYSMLINMENIRQISSPRRLESFLSITYETYALLKEGTDSKVLEQKMKAMGKKYYYPDGDGDATVLLQPMTDIHLNTSVPKGIAPVSDPVYSYILSGVSFLVLFIACVNFMTLSIGRSSSRAKEVGIRKVMGAYRNQLMKQYLGEAILISFLALIIGIIISLFFLPTFNAMSGREIPFNWDFTLILTLMLIMILTGCAAGSYPAAVLSRFMPVSVLKGRQAVEGRNILSKALVVLQFGISVFLIFCTLMMNEQLNYVSSTNLGYDRERVIQIPLNVRWNLRQNQFERLKSELTNSSYIVNVTSAWNQFGIGWTKVGFNDTNGDFREFYVNLVDFDYLNTLDIELVDGRDFSKEFPTDLQKGIIINEAFAKYFNWDNPLSAKLPGNFDDHKFIGVVKDFNYSSLRDEVKPLAIFLDVEAVSSGINDLMGTNFPPVPHYAVVRINKGETQPIIDYIESTWKSLTPDAPFEFSFLDETIEAQYRQDQEWKTIINYSSALAIVIACFGLFGLATITVDKRIKEIGIRKTLGAPSHKIAALVMKEMFLLVVIANAVTWPVSYYAVDKWLQNFAYHISVGWTSFILSGVIVLFISVLTVSYHTLKAANANPVDSLRYE